MKIQIQQVIKTLLDHGVFVFVENKTLKTRAKKEYITQEVISLIKNNKNELIDYLLSEAASAKKSALVAMPRNKQGDVLSFSQQRLWLLDKIDGGSAHYNIPSALRLTGGLNVDALIDALSTIVERHESLRTFFIEDNDGQPLQVIRPTSEIEVLMTDISLLPVGELDLAKLVAKEASKPFDLSSDLMLRAQLIKVADQAHVLLVTMHHIASDGWSMAILINEFSALYQAYVQGEDNPLPELTIQYADYAQWQRDWLQGEVLDMQLGYWKAQLAALPVIHSLPLDKSRPKTQTFNGASHQSIIPSSDIDKLNTLCQGIDGTLFMGLHAAFSVLLARYSNETDIVVGSPIANREQAEVANLIGFFVNTLVLRCDLSNNPSFSELLKQSKSTLLDAYAHQQVPFEQLVEVLQPERSVAHSPLFQVMLVLQNNEEAELELPALTLSQVEQSGGIAKYDLTLTIAEAPKGLQLSWEYNTDLFNDETITRLAKHFDLLLTGLVSLPEESVFSIDMLSKEETHQQLVEWNDTAADYPKDKCIHELFEQQVKATPDAIAVVYEDSQLTYQELNQRANQLAHYLIKERGVTPDTLVGICIERSFEMIVGIMGILKAGGAYAPLDTQYGKEVIRKRVQVINPHVVLIGNSSQDIFESLAISTINLQEEGIEALLCSRDNVTRSAEVDNLAYVLTTSGSTGEPKLIAMQHKTLVNLVEGIKENCLEIKAAHSVLQLASLGFDMSFTEFCLSLLQGGQLHLSRPQEQFDARQLSEKIQGSTISLLNLPYAMLQALATYSNESGIVYPTLSVVLSSAERLIITSEIRAFFMRHSKVRLVNHYGPSETNVCTSNVLSLTSSEWFVEPSIGKPINNVSCYVLGEDGQLLPPGVVGELHVGGMGLAAGYIGDEALTAQKFISNPFYDIAHPSSGERLYKTGDLVKWGNNEELVYIGRADFQVKVRGFRIELGAVESALTIHEMVNEACVLFNEQRHCLIAYISVYDDYSDAVLTTHLSAELPDYMVPSAFVVLESLPLTPNGKVDRKGLPEPDMSLQQKEYVAPTTETEKLLCEIWQEVLRIEQVGITDNFFELGGHSLLAVRLTNLVQKQFAQDVSLRCLMEGPTVTQLAAALSEGQVLTANVELIVPDIKNRYQPFPLTDIQQAYWLGRNGEFELSNVGSHIYNEIVLNNFDITQFQAAWNKMIAHHDMLRMVVMEDGQQRVLETVPDYIFDIIDTRDLDAESAKKERLKLRDSMSHQVFTGLQWPLFDIRICRLSDTKSVLHLSMDALMVDASSIALLAYELSLLTEEPERELRPLALTFRDYVLAHQGLKQTLFYQKSEDYWLARVEDFPARPTLPLAVEPSAIVEQQSERHELVLDKNQWQLLTSRAQQHQVTPTTLFLGCFAEILNRWVEQPHFTLNLTLFNRVPFHEQVNDIIGDFTTLTLLEMDYRQADVSFVKRLVAIQKQLWSDLEHRYFGGMEMLSALRKETGQPVSYPVVVTSTLGLEQPEQADSQSILSNNDEQIYGITQTSQVWLDVQLSDKNGGLQVVWDSVKGLFPDGMLNDMFTALQSLLVNLADDESLWKNNQLLELPQEQVALISAVNDTAQSFETGLLHDPIKKQIHLYSQNKNNSKVAVRTSNKSLTYQELGQRSQVLANQLQAADAAPNHLVAVVMDKGWQQVVAVLGILEAGAAYLPVDASLPQERINLLLSAGEVTQVVTIPAYADCVPEQYITRIINDDCIESEYAALTLDPPTCLQSREKSSDLAYVIFTSGSTGEPKGVMTDHQGALNTINDINQRYQVSANDSMFGLSNLSFDLSVYDIFGVLGAGGTLVLPQPEEYRDPKAWLQYLNTASSAEPVTLWNTVPALMQMLVEYCEDNAADDISLDLRLVLMSGDWIPTDLPARIHGVTESAELISLGGATEASIWSIYYPIEQVENDWTSIPYGKALANQQFHVLQQDLSQSPLWVTGDLYIGGIGVAKGYWRDAEKTAASFITHPVTNERLYKTGDRGRLLPDGNIEFMGRNDHQVKIQGFRVELGEIESCLMSHPDISDAIVTTHTVNRAHNLVAYVVGNSISSSDAENETQATQVSLSSAEKLAFKLANKAVKGHSARSPINFDNDLDEGLSLALHKRKNSAFDQAPITVNALGELLRGYYRRKFEGQLFPKGYYPSGGTLYPVQVYLEIAEHKVTLPNGQYLSAGYYYYHPLHHHLLVLANNEVLMNNHHYSSGAFRLFLVADYAAIEPIYGNLSEPLCRLEAGYMSQLLEANGTSGLAVNSEHNNTFDVQMLPGITEEHELLAVYVGGNVLSCTSDNTLSTSATFASQHVELVHCNSDGCQFDIVTEIAPIVLTPIARKSYRSYLSAAPSLDAFALMMSVLHQYAVTKPLTVQLYIHIRKALTKQNSDTAVEPGLYQYHAIDNRLTRVNKKSASKTANLFGQYNRAMEGHSAFGIFFVEQGNYKNTAYKEAGSLAQLLSNYAVQLNIGLCAMGQTSETNVRAAFELKGSDHIIHSLIGGAISDEQIASLEESTTEEVNVRQELSDYLQKFLPHYMIPKHIILIPKIPLTANGKINRKDLPEPDFGTDEGDYVAPQTDIEKVLCEIWVELLDVEQVGITDNFYLLGGNSLLITRMITRIQHCLGVTIPLALVYNEPIIQVISMHIQNIQVRNMTELSSENECVEELL